MNIKRYISSKKKHRLKKDEQRNAQSRLNDITSKLNLLEDKNDMIKLNPNNSEHMDWWEDN